MVHGVCRRIHRFGEFVDAIASRTASIEMILAVVRCECRYTTKARQPQRGSQRQCSTVVVVDVDVVLAHAVNINLGPIANVVSLIITVLHPHDIHLDTNDCPCVIETPAGTMSNTPARVEADVPQQDAGVDEEGGQRQQDEDSTARGEDSPY